MKEINTYKINLFQNMQDKELVVKMTKEYKSFLHENDIRPNSIMLNVLQIPIYMTWFFSLRDFLSNQTIMANINNNHFYWIQGFESTDPYFILPIIGCFSSYFAIINMMKENKAEIDPQQAQILQYIKFVPFVSFPFLATLPAGLNLYFFTLIWTNFFFSKFMNKLIPKIFKIPDYYPGTHLEKITLNKKTKNDEGIPNQN